MLVQFENNWIQKIPRTAKLNSAYGLVQFGSPQNFSHPIISKLDRRRQNLDRIGPDHGSDHGLDHGSDHGSDHRKKKSFKQKKNPKKIKSFIR